jgi:hypothetical protein
MEPLERLLKGVREVSHASRCKSGQRDNARLYIHMIVINGLSSWVTNISIILMANGDPINWRCPIETSCLFLTSGIPHILHNRP